MSSIDEAELDHNAAVMVGQADQIRTNLKPAKTLGLTVPDTLLVATTS